MNTHTHTPHFLLTVCCTEFYRNQCEVTLDGIAALLTLNKILNLSASVSPSVRWE